MKTKEEPAALKAEAEDLGSRLKELDEQELAQAAGGANMPGVILVQGTYMMLLDCCAAGKLAVGETAQDIPVMPVGGPTSSE